MNRDDKRRLRQTKRLLKRAGNKSRRQHLKRELAENPEDAPHSSYDFGRQSSEALNGLDDDATRRRTDHREDAGKPPEETNEP